MNTSGTEWQNFKNTILNDIKENLHADTGLVFRGQSNSNWKLQTSYHRLPNPKHPISDYPEIILKMADQIETLTGKKWDVTKPEDNGALLGFLQHNGFPTPLLDWSFSPYIATYFAFEGVNDKEPESEFVSIYIFNLLGWQKDFKQCLSLDDPNPHVSILESKIAGNTKYMVQQGVFLFSNVENIVEHIEAHQRKTGKDYFTKFDLPIKEKPIVMKDLNLMGINAFSLFPNIEGLCHKGKEQYFPATIVEFKKPEKPVSLADLVPIFNKPGLLRSAANQGINLK